MCSSGEVAGNGRCGLGGGVNGITSGVVGNGCCSAKGGFGRGESLIRKGNGGFFNRRTFGKRAG